MSKLSMIGRHLLNSLLISRNFYSQKSTNWIASLHTTLGIPRADHHKQRVSLHRGVMSVCPEPAIHSTFVLTQSCETMYLLHQKII